MLMTVCWLVMPAANRAVAAGPTSFTQGQVSGRVGALGSREQEVDRAPDRLLDEGGLWLSAVYGGDSSGRSSQLWGQDRAQDSGLGVSDALLAVTTRDQQDAHDVDVRSPLTPMQANEIGGEPVHAVDATPPGGAAADRGQEVGETGGTPLFLLALFAAVFVLAVYTVVRGIRRGAARSASPDAEGGWAEQPAALPELDAKARKALVDTDDAVRTSQEELGFAAAQFGEEATRPFAHALEQAKTELTAAFRLRQQLDDAYPEDDETRWRMLEEIMVRCAVANRVLDAESEDFDRLRAFERNAPQALAAAEAAAEEASGRLVSGNAEVSALRERFAPSAAAPVERDLREARSRLEFAKNSLHEGRSAVERNDNGAVAIRVRAAEAAVAQARRLIDAVGRRSRELAQAAEALPGALTE
ncbi:hypothetical protein OQI_33225, partial [Streptomyces pharetrae CZA14]